MSNKDSSFFKDKTHLIRWIDPNALKKSNTVSPTSFEIDLNDPAEKRHLSVNAIEIESIEEIAKYYFETLQNKSGKVALSDLKVNHYNDAGKKINLDLNFNRQEKYFEFEYLSKSYPAYKHRPVPKRDNRIGSLSHCGVEYYVTLNHHKMKQISRRLAQKTGKCHIIEV